MQKVVSRREQAFSNVPMWKALLKNSLPMILIMLIFGIYILVDSILAVRLAPDAYKNNATAQIIGLKNYVRLTITAGNPIAFLIQGVALFFSLGISTRVSINLGQKRIERAQNTIRTGFQIEMAFAIVLVLTLLFAATPWMELQYPASQFGTVVDDGYKYISIIIGAVPLIFFSHTIASLFRVDVRLNEMVVAIVVPIFLNLLFDYILMGPAAMGVEGGAWATFISYAVTSLLFILFAIRKKSQLIKIKNLFGKFRIISIIGILLVGTAPLLGNFAPAIIQTANFNVIKNVSSHVFETRQTAEISQTIANYKAGLGPNESFRLVNGAWSELTGQVVTNYNQIDPLVVSGLQMTLSELVPVKPVPGIATTDYPNVLWETVIKQSLVARTSGSFMSIASSGAFPVFALFFPILFGFIQGATPLVSYNYGAKNFAKVKQAFKYLLLYSFITGVLVYVIGAVVLANQLFEMLGVSPQYKPYAKTIILIELLATPLFSVAIAGMVILTSTDKIIASIIGAAARSLIFFFPLLYSFQALAIGNPDPWWLFWWSVPIGALFSSVLICGMTIFTLSRLHIWHIDLDNRIEDLYTRFDKKLKAKNA